MALFRGDHCTGANSPICVGLPIAIPTAITPVSGAMEQLPWEGRALDMEDVDVKNLLETGRTVLERSVLKELIERLKYARRGEYLNGYNLQ
ncbi:hypothetical protein ACHAO9_012152 [Fusarium lateritium]